MEIALRNIARFSGTAGSLNGYGASRFIDRKNRSASSRTRGHSRATTHGEGLPMGAVSHVDASISPCSGIPSRSSRSVLIHRRSGARRAFASASGCAESAAEVVDYLRGAHLQESRGSLSAIDSPAPSRHSSHAANSTLLR